jgi:predicted DCC family thiol-disulfide oxidoreductase YuxK
MQTPAIVIYDGECSFCDGSVQFMLDHDPKGRFRFAASQSEAGRQLLVRAGLPPEGVGSIVLIEDGKVYTKTTASLRIARKLRGLSPLAYPLILIPRVVRDFFYDLFAANRYRWFGKLEQCRLPSPEQRERFLDIA